jgi:penicillin G amidase
MAIGRDFEARQPKRARERKRRMRRGRRTWQWLVPLLCSGLLTGCSLFRPLPKATTIEQRLAGVPNKRLPLQGRVTVYWDEHQIPFIDAETDDDAAFALGLVHAHLRLGQMAIYRRIAHGRIAEMGGPLAVDIDHGIRILDFSHAAPATLAAMPEATRRWLQRFVDGVNHYQATAKRLPFEYRILGLQREPWTVADVLTFGRLAGADVTWIVWFNLLKLRDRPDWPQIWARLLQQGGDSAAPADSSKSADEGMANILAGLSRSGSNSLAIGPGRTRNGGAILANDPHLGINLPNTWLLAGVKSPSYHAAGLMIPGLPLFAIGRNPWIAWGGTNMRASASDLIDVSALPETQKSARTETIRVRWWLDQEVTVRDTRFGPILSNAPQLRDLHLADLSLRWTGHQPSDEVTAMLKVARARTFDEFRSAFASFAVPGQNMLYADQKGNIGQVMAVRIPDRRGAPEDLIVDASTAERMWERLRDATTLPATANPEEGYIVSANNKPPDGDIAVGFFFSPDDRIRRMAALIKAAGTVDVDQVMAMQRDVHVGSSAALNEVLVRKLRRTGIADQATGEARRVFELMAGWDGQYRVDAQEPVAFELFRFHFTQQFYQAAFGDTDWAAFAGVGRIKALLIEDIETAEATALAPSLRRSLDLTAEKIREFPTWGDMHRLALRHPLAFLPVVGRRFEFADYPIGGSSDSLMKTAHPMTDRRHRAGYGSNARHISDLSDMDRNWFVLLGGQDGWLNSSTFLDQVPLWLEGRYVEMPLRVETVRARFRYVTELGS